MRNLIEDKNAEIKHLNEYKSKLKDKLYEAEQIRNRILTQLQQAKDEKLRLEVDLESKEKELIDLKKKFKLLRREVQKL